MQKYDYSATSALDIVTKHTNLETSDKEKRAVGQNRQPFLRISYFGDVLRDFFHVARPS